MLMLSKIRSYLPSLYTLCSGLLVLLAMPDQASPWIPGMFCVAPLLYDVNRNRSFRYVMIQTFWFQVLTAFSAFSWIHVGIESLWQKDKILAYGVYFLLVPFATSYISLWGAIRFYLRKHISNPAIVVLTSSAFFAVLDSIFSFQNVMFANLIYSSPALLSYAPYGGATLMTFFVFLFSELLALAVDHQKKIIQRALVLIIVVIIYVLGSVLSHQQKTFAGQGKDIRVLLVGTNFSPKRLFSHYQYEITKDYSLSREVESLLEHHEAEIDQSDVVVLPESLMLTYFFRPQTEEEKKLKDRLENIFRRHSKTLFIYGGFTFSNSVEKFANVIVFAHALGNELRQQAFKKQILMPFGEIIPGSESLPFLEKVFFEERIGSVGTNIPLFDYGGFKIAGLLCNEVFHYELFARARVNGARLVSVVGNEVWVAGTRAHHLLLSSTVLRAVESGLPVIKAANGGLSYTIDPTGKVVFLAQAKSSGFTPTSLQVGPENKTFYSEHPQFLLYGFAIITLAVLSAAIFQSRRKRIKL